MSAHYPNDPAGRDRWILARRGSRNLLNPSAAYAELHEEEPDGSGGTVPVSTIFLTNRECPWRCLMCDLWRNTLEQAVPAGAIPAQIAHALARLPAARWVKLYNAGSFFDPKAVPPGDHPAVARMLDSFDRIVVESHPALCGDSALRFRDLCAGALEVALGLETVHPEVLPRLNKRMSLEDFRRAAEFLRRGGVSVRAFVLVGLPFVALREAPEWAARSAAFAFDCGAGVVSLIPTRPGNGALDALAQRREFSPPDLRALEEAAEAALSLRGGRVLADLWDLERLGHCGECFTARSERLRAMNRSQTAPPRIACPAC